MKNVRSARGVTLVILVITVIIMLILVTVTINTILDGGLFEHAGKAGSETNSVMEKKKRISKHSY